jgi:glycosyltransferase involved in cell wall biosynthesis
MRDMESLIKKNAPPENTQEALWEKLFSLEEKYNDYEFPKVSVVIPTFNCVQSIATTLESVLNQEYPDLEVLIVDAGSTDHTLEIVKNYRDKRIHIYSVSGYQRYEMLNRGISQSSGGYINFLFPGDFYIYPSTLMLMMSLALDQKRPHLVFCGTLLRNGTEVKLLYRPISLKLLKRGRQPTSLQSCWFRTDTFRKIGKFNGTYSVRGGFDLMCRFCLDADMRFASIYRILTDYDLRAVTRWMVVRHFWETMRTVNKYYGVLAVVHWLFHQKDVARFVKMWVKSVKVAFGGTK